MAERTKRPVMIVKKSTMDEEMEKHAVGTAVRALKQFTVEKNAARFIKEEFDDHYGGLWHVIVGKHFGGFVSHFNNDFIYFYVNNVAIMLYRTGSERM